MATSPDFRTTPLHFHTNFSQNCVSIFIASSAVLPKMRVMGAQVLRSSAPPGTSRKRWLQSSHDTTGFPCACLSVCTVERSGKGVPLWPSPKVTRLSHLCAYWPAPGNRSASLKDAPIQLTRRRPRLAVGFRQLPQVQQQVEQPLLQSL